MMGQNKPNQTERSNFFTTSAPAQSKTSGSNKAHAPKVAPENQRAQKQENGGGLPKIVSAQ